MSLKRHMPWPAITVDAPADAMQLFTARICTLVYATVCEGDASGGMTV